jgi:hypothetical protein
MFIIDAAKEVVKKNLSRKATSRRSEPEMSSLPGIAARAASA